VAKEDSGAAETGASAATASALQARFRDVADKIRERADATAKAVGALGSALLTAVGITKIGDFWPLPDTDQGWLAAGTVVGSFVVMAAVLAFFTFRLWRMNEPLVYATDVSEMPDLRSKAERAEVERVYKQMWELNRVPSLRAYEARAHRLYRVADRTVDPAEAARIRADADLIAAEIGATQSRAALSVIRRRAANALKGKKALFSYAAFVLAAIAFALATDWLESERTSKIAVAKDCLAAAKAGAKRDNLPSLCRDQLPATPAKEGAPSPASKVREGREAIAAALTKCEAAADETEANDAAQCEPLRLALKEVAG